MSQEQMVQATQAFPCPYCHAKPGSPCTKPDGKTTYNHGKRIDKALAAERKVFLAQR